MEHRSQERFRVHCNAREQNQFIQPVNFESRALYVRLDHRFWISLCLYIADSEAALMYNIS